MSETGCPLKMQIFLPGVFHVFYGALGVAHQIHMAKKAAERYKSYSSAHKPGHPRSATSVSS